MNRKIAEMIKLFDECPTAEGKRVLQEEAGEHTAMLLGLTAPIIMHADGASLQTFYCIGLGELVAMMESGISGAEQGDEFISAEDRFTLINAQMRLAYRVTVAFMKEDAAKEQTKGSYGKGVM